MIYLQNIKKTVNKIIWYIKDLERKISIRILTSKYKPTLTPEVPKDMLAFSKKRKEEKNIISRWESEGGRLSDDRKIKF